VSIPKPQDTLWTDDQWLAISERGSNLLVAAAAGSGKTAVLVERIIRRITDHEAPADVDRLLVATFTKAAADEMRHRIRDALEQQLAVHKGDEHLARQLALLNKAAITTLHSFCLEVVQTHFYKIPIDPVFRIANETEAELLKSESIEELFEHEYGKTDNEPFLQLVDCFGGERSDEAVISLVLRLYEFSRSHPWPEHWLQETASRFRSASDSTSDLFELMLQEVEAELVGCQVLLHAALDLCEEPGGPEPYAASLQDDLRILRSLLDYAEQRDWDGLKQLLDTIQFARLKACRGDSYDRALVEMAKELRNSVKDKISGLHDELFQRTAEQYVEELVMLSPIVEVLIALVSELSKRYSEKKQEKGLVDFNDLEHYCLTILRDPASTPQHLIPSEVALAYQNRFTEVLLDEYQDTNRVQEMIVELISKPEGNRFMVGDVKQSIYRFRLAEPGLFLEKYRSYLQQDGGRRIDLSQNFRSRREVVDAVNYIFKQIMYERAAEIAYDESAELRYGASYYDEPDEAVPDNAVELLVADRSALGDHGTAGPNYDEEPSDGEDAAYEDDAAELETVQVEARMIGLRIAELMGHADAGGKAHQVYDKGTKSYRAPTYRDIVILLRATQAWAPVIIEELRMLGIPAYADLSTGYFTATEVQVMMSLLKVIDNPLQDIPLAGVLRSPMFRFTAEELALIRVCSPRTGFFEAVERAAARMEECVSHTVDAVDPDSSRAGSDDTSADRYDIDEALRNKLQSFLDQLHSWRTDARQGSLADLIWRIYRETGYYDLVGGLPGGLQRQANLRALYDRARAYEATSFRGLFRFLRFIERMQDSGSDLGTARALGEQEDVVRIMSIHKSKGLEFPIVFVAGLSKQFNEQDLRQSFLLHKEWGLGPKFVDPNRRVSLPSLAWLAVRRQLKSEMLAEEMRILYVALTRAREKLILVSSFRTLEKEVAKWQRLVIGSEHTLSDHAVLSARSYADWIFPALARHQSTSGFAAWGGGAPSHTILTDRSEWRMSLVPVEALLQAAAVQETRSSSELSNLLQAAIAAGTATDGTESGVGQAEPSGLLWQRFDWSYPHKEATSFLSKITVTEIKRLAEQQKLEDEAFSEEVDIHLLQQRPTPSRITLVERPSFMADVKLSAAERGTAYHTVMQHVRLDEEVTEESITRLIDRLVSMELLTTQQAAAVDGSQIAKFYRSEVGIRMARASQLYREQPFSYRLPASEVYREAEGEAAQESMLIQGVIDCLFVEPDGIVLVDYKTDRTAGRDVAEVASRYDIQISLYARAVSDIWHKPVKESYLYFFDGPYLVNRSIMLNSGAHIRHTSS